MFRAVKAHYTLEVTLKDGAVKVKPVQPNKERGIVHRTLARCEEFLAQVALQEEASITNITNLVLHFKRRGWQVQ
jgi:hypothetical protein